MQQEKLAKLTLLCSIRDLLALTTGFVDLPGVRRCKAPRWVSAGVHHVSEGTCYRAEAETTARPSFNINLCFIHCVFHWGVLRSDAQCGCPSEPLRRTRVHQEKHFFEAEHTVQWAILRKERVFQGGVIPVPSSSWLKWAGSLCWCFRTTTLHLALYISLFLIPAVGHWTPAHACLLVSGISSLPMGLWQHWCFKENCRSHALLWYTICKYGFFTVYANFTIQSVTNKTIIEEKWLSYKENCRIKGCSWSYGVVLHVISL